MRTPATALAPTSLPGYGRVDLARPFLDTPAQNWSEGIAGLKIPVQPKVERHHAGAYSSLFAPDARADLQDCVVRLACRAAEEDRGVYPPVSYLVACAFDPGSRVLGPFVRSDTDCIVPGGL
ncbi:hypothetical protein G3I59_18905 [Amycolatopsis rubida]|uniref:Uncharacterized protein n=1 Tax=Amycolatopsis rubida TaxID=112413 RepID=A0ABX0BT76_9PSEU|nr:MULTISPECIES: hypothetical protein [Amycolatopsis]MYW92620.1 hypothetical protein [Amycolatopsis rubida]NEC57605.1 hypothetical protein [Amycolatopsis rubida]OAP26259.1 hypothetical protein A4R44_02246 [Amycolatopsis sp. M39]